MTHVRGIRQSTFPSTSSFPNPSSTTISSDRKRSYEVESSTSSSPSKVPRIERSLSSPTPPVASSRSSLAIQPVRSSQQDTVLLGHSVERAVTPASTTTDQAPPGTSLIVTTANAKPSSPSPPRHLEPSSFLDLGTPPTLHRHGLLLVLWERKFLVLPSPGARRPYRRSLRWRQRDESRRAEGVRGLRWLGRDGEEEVEGGEEREWWRRDE